MKFWIDSIVLGKVLKGTLQADACKERLAIK